VGTVTFESNGFAATTTLIKIPRSDSAKLDSSDSRFNSSWRTRRLGSDSLIAIRSRTVWSRPTNSSQIATAIAQVSAWVPVWIAGPAKLAGNCRNTSDAAPYARAVALAEKALR